MLVLWQEEQRGGGIVGGVGHFLGRLFKLPCFCIVFNDGLGLPVWHLRVLGLFRQVAYTIYGTTQSNPVVMFEDLRWGSFPNFVGCFVAWDCIFGAPSCQGARFYGRFAFR